VASVAQGHINRSVSLGLINERPIHMTRTCRVYRLAVNGLVCINQPVSTRTTLHMHGVVMLSQDVLVSSSIRPPSVSPTRSSIGSNNWLARCKL